MASTSEKTTAAKRAVDKAARKAEKKLQQQQQAQQQAAAAAAQAASQMNNNHEDSSVKVVHEEQILEAIDQLRRRKARPDADRICNYLLRKFSVDARDTIADLHLLIESEKVIQVDYKGNTSYRNASKWTRLQLYKNRPEGFVKEKINSSMVASAVAELVIEEPDYLDQGVPAIRLVEQLLDGVSNPTSRRMVEDFLSKEVASGNLARFVNGNYSLVDGSHMSSNGAAAPQQNGELAGKARGPSSSITAASTPFKEASNPYDLNEFEEFASEHDSSSNTLKSSRQTSPKTELEPMKKEECYEIIMGKRQANEEEDKQGKDSNGKLSNGIQKDEDIKQNGGSLSSPYVEKEETKSTVEAQTNYRKSKTERKQRLCVRSDDSTDMFFNYEDFRKKRTNKEENDKRDDGNDRLSEDGEAEHDAGRSSTNPSPTPSNTNAGSFRSARRKRAKKVFDPSDNMVVKRKRGRQPNALKALLQAQQEAQDAMKAAALKESPKDPNRHCSLCSKDKQEALTACRDCTVRAHPSCIYTPEEIMNKTHTSWQCERCKTCVVCYETSEAGPLVACYSCDDAFHYTCHTPRIPVSKAKWNCHECSQKQYKPAPQQNSNSNWNNNSTEHQSNNIPHPILSPHVSPGRNAPEPMDDDIPREAIDPNIPDASDWTSEQVYQYFARLFPKEAEIFRHQEIDGHSLLLLKRSDVLGGLDLLLGPALKIYRHVLKLQVRRDDPKLYWL
ncbi:histone-lysine N-methyltransferase 2D [Nasonia vitripennis]|uniref:Atherin n=1 Tax=Nasonia vitripennis TaxID=7425 RepID=A0A7M7IY51_NASVI|nr:histone-lysine N-methyltransferase 2D [Nasonia vitripennis]XP_016840863.1 histone-lysine N-methyltransferase 2D [Nasonia vitripennis]XP_032458201.1 histone-lysine N-methyltransferase 2D [Nasonia vitripennis]XP_032458202.1 histone-lysine N-methyltransferase 2D [Nasonia vitripennis]